ncbi:MAG: O-antigen ligase family protein [Clostridia bacterium]|nr:O-antigen ligase family protein [Clostridia bacterium]
MNFKLNLLSFGKLLVLIFVLYTGWFRYAYGIRQILLYAPPIALTATILLHMITHGNLNIRGCPSIIIAFFALAIYAFASGNIVAVNKSYCISSVATFFAHSLICFAVYYISKEEKSINWILNILIICGILCSAYAYLRGIARKTSGVDAIVLGEANNPNFLGMVMLTSIFALIYDFDKFRKRMVLSTVLLAAFAGVVILTSSRECFLTLVITVVWWIFAFMKALAKEEHSGGSIFHNSIYQIFILLGVGLSIVYFINNFEGTGVYTKIVNSITQGDGLNSRKLLYQEAWRLFKRHYPTGVGFDQFRFYTSSGFYRNMTFHGHYSHSTYAEIASCLGIFGILIFFIPLGLGYLKTIAEFLKHRDYKISMLLIMFTAELMLGLGTIFIYEFYQMLILTIIFYECQQIEKSNAKGEIYEKPHKKN